MSESLHHLFVRSEESIRNAMQRMDEAAKGIVLVVDQQQCLIDTLTDGDVRRGLLSGLKLDQSVADIVQHKDRTGRQAPHTGKVNADTADHVQRMKETGIRHLPLVDDNGRVCELAVLGTDATTNNEDLPVQAVIMAGGFGTRLRPLTDDTPKPMLPVGGTPLMERTINRLRSAGISRINVTTHYMPEKITQHFGNGQKFGVDLNYVAEDQPLGTAGALGLVGAVEEPLLVMNGDILTSIDFRSLLEFHQRQQADLTVCVRQFDLQVPYGVIEAQDGEVRSMCEKPRIDFLVNAGIYLLEPSVRRYIPEDTRYDMTDLINRLLADKRTVASYPIVEYWLDIGKHDDFERAQQDIQQVRWAS